MKIIIMSLLALLTIFILLNTMQLTQKSQEIETKYIQPYSPKLAHTLGGFTVASYCKQSKIENWNCGKACKQNNLSDIKVVYVKETNALVYTGYSPDLNAIVIVFRGTMPLSVNNWKSNITFAKVQHSQCKDCKVHKGFNNLYESLKKELWQNLKQIQNKYPYAKIMLTGHSLGGALSTLCAADLIQNGINGFTWYNFGSPRVGNIEFQQYLEKQYSQRVYRITHDRDPVVHLPPKGFGFHHLSQEIFYGVDPEPYDSYSQCNLSGEDQTCANKYKVFASWKIEDHNNYMGYNYLGSMATCNL